MARFGVLTRDYRSSTATSIDRLAVEIQARVIAATCMNISQANGIECPTREWVASHSFIFIGSVRREYA